jgi:hypothetical protein
VNPSARSADPPAKPREEIDMRGRLGNWIPAALALTLWIAAAPSDADTRKVVTRCTNSMFEDTVKELRYEFSVIADDTYRFEADGLKVVFINKKLDVQLYAVWDEDVSIEHVNQFNQQMRFIRAYLDEDGDPVLEADLDFEGGVTQDSFERFIRLFVQLAESYSEHLHRFAPKDRPARLAGR